MTESEILVIGGGIAGASAAYHLALGGHSVVLLERGEIASEASGVNAGNIGAIGWGDSPNLQSHLTMGSLELFKSLQLDLSFDIEFRNSGCIQAIQTEQQYDFIRDRVIRWNSSPTGKPAASSQTLAPNFQGACISPCAPKPTRE